MKNILRKAENAEKLLKLTSDTLLLIDKDGICVDIAVSEADLWLIKEDKLRDRNIFHIIPPETRDAVYPNFQRVLKYKIRSTQNYKLECNADVRYFKCIMSPYDDMVLCQYRDITERSQRKIEIEKKNKELSEVQKAALVGNWTYNTTTDIFNYSGYYLFGPTGVKQYHMSEYLKLVLLEDRSNFNQWLENCLKGVLSDSVDYRILLNNGVFYIRLKTYSRERQRDGSIQLEGYIQDLTDIQRRRNDINLLTHAIHNCHDVIYAAHEDGTLIFCNRRFREFCDLGNVEDITQFKVYDMPTIHWSKESWDNFVDKVKDGEAIQGRITYNPFPTHPEVLGLESTSNFAISDEGEHTVWIFGKNISKRIHSEEQTKQYTQVLDRILERLPASIVVKDINNDFKYVYRNRKSYRYGNVKQDMTGKSDFDLHSFEDATQKRAEDKQVATTGEELHYIMEDKAENGQTIYLDKRKLKVEGDNISPLILNIEWDITEMELMKRELIVAKEKAETSDRLKSAFLANMSHEIRTPLNAIVGFSRIIAECNNSDERMEYYKIVESNNERLLMLINEILDLSRIESGSTKFSIARVHLFPICHDIHDSFTFRCPEGVALVFEPSDKRTIIEVDKNRLFQVISNLIGNALKFTTKGSIRYGYRREGENVVFYVSDTGTGIAPDKVDKVFDRFVKADDFVQGTGLGLSICKTIVEHLGGTISVQSELGKGTTFTFVLPIKSTCPDNEREVPSTDTESSTAASEMELTDESSGPLDENAPLILVAEDNESNYMLIKAILGRTYHLEHANDGMEAVTMYENFHPDLILMDLKMPNLNGLDATRIIRELSSEVPIIALTAYAFEHDNEAAREAGCNSFLTKPVTQEILKKTIKKWLKIKPEES